MDKEQTRKGGWVEWVKKRDRMRERAERERKRDRERERGEIVSVI